MNTITTNTRIHKMYPIPVIDLQKLSSNSNSLTSEEWKQISRKFCNALSQMGCAYLVNHGISGEKVRISLCKII